MRPCGHWPAAQVPRWKFATLHLNLKPAAATSLSFVLLVMPSRMFYILAGLTSFALPAKYKHEFGFSTRSSAFKRQ